MEIAAMREGILALLRSVGPFDSRARMAYWEMLLVVAPSGSIHPEVQ